MVPGGSTRPITVHESTAICKSQLEPIIENPGNMRGAEEAFGRFSLFQEIFGRYRFAGCIFLEPTLVYKSFFSMLLTILISFSFSAD